MRSKIELKEGEERSVGLDGMSGDELLNYLREEWLNRSWGRCGESKEGYGYRTWTVVEWVSISYARGLQE